MTKASCSTHYRRQRIADSAHQGEPDQVIYGCASFDFVQPTLAQPSLVIVEFGVTSALPTRTFHISGILERAQKFDASWSRPRTLQTYSEPSLVQTDTSLIKENSNNR